MPEQLRKADPQGTLSGLVASVNRQRYAADASSAMDTKPFLRVTF
ncbi:MAG TPA: hypothetical protein VFF84_14490 [Sphingobium sp.]|nr:hypothetical protein [Sphingobium sp.]